MSTNKNIWIGLAMIILSAIGLTFVVKFHAKHIKQDEAMRLTNRELSIRTRSLEIKNADLIRNLDSMTMLEPEPPKVITIIKKVPPKDWWVASPTDTVRDSIFWYGVPVDTFSLMEFH